MSYKFRTSGILILIFLVVYWYEGEIIEDFFLLDVVIYILK
jgi:hypothetical protein